MLSGLQISSRVVALGPGRASLAYGRSAARKRKPGKLDRIFEKVCLELLGAVLGEGRTLHLNWSCFLNTRRSFSFANSDNPETIMNMMKTISRHPAARIFTFACTLFLLPTVLVAQEETPTHKRVSYGPEERQWLNLYLPSGEKPTPVFIYAHHNGSTADDVKSSWANPTLAGGTAIVSWESIAKVNGMSDFQKCAADAKLMFAWVKKNAATYNWNSEKIIIGGQSRGSFVSWQLAHSHDKSIVGIYMGQALPGKSFSERLLDPITKNAPPIFLAYRKEPGVVGDNHDPAHGLKVLEKYKELGIGDSAELVHSLSDTKNSEVMQFLPKFVRSVAK